MKFCIRYLSFKACFTCGLLWVYTTGKAQNFEFGLSRNHLSNGLTCVYNKPFGQSLEVGFGLRYMVNMFSINKNSQHHAYYQNGYADDIGEHFGLILRPALKLYRRKDWGVYLQTNFLLTNQSLRYKALFFETRTGEFKEEVVFFDNALALEGTIGLRGYCQLNSKVSIQAAGGVGYVVMNYSRKGRLLYSNLPLYSYSPSSPFASRERGDGEFVGLDGLPSLYACVSYRLGRR